MTLNGFFVVISERPYQATKMLRHRRDGKITNVTGLATSVRLSTAISCIVQASFLEKLPYLLMLLTGVYDRFSDQKPCREEGFKVRIRRNVRFLPPEAVARGAINELLRIQAT